MTTDDLSTPLGHDTQPHRRRRLPFSGVQVIAAALGLFLLGFAGIALFHQDRLGGEPVVRVALQPDTAAKNPDKDMAAPADAAKPGQPASKAASNPPANGQKTITIIDGSSGARQDVVVASESSATGAETTSAIMSGVDARLLEKSRYGMIPVIADGVAPFTAYAAGTPAERAKAATMPTVTIVVGGLGIGAAKTTESILNLPGAVTLAFTPYGSDPAKLVARARGRHHEILLQVPMEPFDYPDNDPGPQTLLTAQSPEQNLDRLFWHLSRLQGYVGLTSFMGARFTVSDTAMQPVIREAAKRGLGYLDDGSSPRSVAGTLAQGQNMPFAKADLSIDAVPTAAEIDKALAKLESLAKTRGSAIGIASSLPVSVERIGNWAKALESRGVLLVPLTTAILKSKS
ncbi:MAG: divergent polysaccharide deacetylase family protein [Rhizobiales bacterium]|nr:divergent polysaccharide deacetylase family protein [Hyphomicrobiales bacterium]MBN8983895.1 divergent polysaccharide deacetylase family protein [Hyphomicrobiales bacterium]